MRSKADAAGVVLLALILLGSGALALLGYDAGLGILLLMVGFLAGWTVAYLLTKPRRYRGWVSVALGLAILVPFLASVFGLARGIEWMVIDLGFDSFGGTLWFGFTLAVIQVIVGRFSGRGFWDEDRTRGDRYRASR